MIRGTAKFPRSRLIARDSRIFWVRLAKILSTFRFHNSVAVMAAIGIFTILRLPAILHQPGGQDEQFFAVPGYTVYREGIPRIPYFPARARETFFENADRCLMALPPGLFYAQAPFFAVFRAGYPTARIPSFLAGAAAIAFVFVLARSGFRLGMAAASLGAILFCLSRPLLFTSTIARPDLICALFGALAAAVWLLGPSIPSVRQSILMGLLSGTAGLFHPFALVFLAQLALPLAIRRTDWHDKIKTLLGLGTGTVIPLSLWGILILRFPNEFRSQFFANVFERSGPGLFSRLVWPFPSLAHHARLLVEFCGPWQCLLFAVVLLTGTWRCMRVRNDPQQMRFMWLVWSSLYFTATFAGVHPTKGYWVYATILLCVVVAMVYESITKSLSFRIALTAIVLALMLPGAGLRSSWIYLRYWGEPRYHAPTFIAQVLDGYPHDGLYLADLSYVFDIYLTGRRTLLLKDPADYRQQFGSDFDFIFSAWEGNDASLPQRYKAESFRRHGDQSDPQSCYVDVFRRTAK